MFQILTPNQTRLKLFEQEKLRKKYEFKLRLNSLINCIEGICESAISHQQDVVFPKIYWMLVLKSIMKIFLIKV